MYHVSESLDHQTAPESTRGLFDPPEEAPPAMNTDKRKSFQTSTSSVDGDRQPSRHQRSRSAITPDMLPNQNGRRNFGLQTLTEEGEDSHRRKQEDVASITVDSLQDMINTLKTLPPITSKDDRRNSQRRSTPSTLSAGTQPRRMSYNDALKHRGTFSDNASEHEDDSILSREAARAEAEAKLMGTFRRDDTNSEKNDSQPTKSNNRQSFGFQRRRGYSDASSNVPAFDVSQFATPSVSTNQRMSLQLPPLSENTDVITWTGQGRHGNPNRTLSFDDPRRQRSRRSSRTFDDWRLSGPPPTSTSSTFSPRTSYSSNRMSLNLGTYSPARFSMSRDDANPNQRRALFTAHLPFSATAPLLRNRLLVGGMLRVNKRNRSDAYVFCEELDADIYICGSRDRNRALEGDIVAVKLVEVDRVLHEKKEKEEAKLSRNGGQVRQRLPDEEDENEIIFGGDDDVETVKPKYCGVVVAVQERAQNQLFSGAITLMRPNNKRAQEEKAAEENGSRKDAPRIVWFKATDKRVPLIAIPIEQAPPDFVERSEQYEKRLFVGSIKRWPITSLHPFGTLERELGDVNEVDVQTAAILADNNITQADFTDQVQDCFPPFPYEFSEVPDENRQDLRHLRTFTIDAAGSQVLDDAVSVQRLSDDAYELGVHIADVSYFIKPGSTLDKEVRMRGIRVDLVNKSVPMIPQVLTDQATNLVPNKARLAFSVIWKLNSKGNILDIWFGKTVIESVAQLTFEDAQRALDDLPIESIADDKLCQDIGDDIRMLKSIALMLPGQRLSLKGSPLRPDDIEYTFGTQGDMHPTGATFRQRLEAELLVDEFLLFTNKCVAQKISSNFPEYALLRRQAPPLDRKIHELKEYVQDHLGVQLNITNASTVEQSIQSIEDDNVRRLVSTIALKTFQPPKYFCTGTLDISRFSHYTNNIPLFTHFTAPSRRFADIVVHRQLEVVVSHMKLTQGDSFLTHDRRGYLDRESVQRLARHFCTRSDAALRAREQSSALFLALYLNHLIKQQPNSNVLYREATVVAVFDQFFDVFVPELNLQRRIHISNLPVWHSEYDAGKRALTIFWRRDMAMSTGENNNGHHQSDDEYDDEELDEDMLVAEMQSEASGPSSSDEVHKQKSVSVSTTPKLDERTVQTLSIQPTRSSPPTLQRPPEASKSTTRRQSIINARLSSSTGFSSEHGSQTIKALDRIRVLVIVDIVRTPPLIRILASNPFT